MSFRIAPDGQRRKRYNFGPNGRAVYRLIALLEVASSDEWAALAAYPVDNTAKSEANSAAVACMRKASRGFFRNRADDAVRNAAVYSPGDNDRFATVFDYQSATVAALVGDLVGKHGYTQQHHDTLTGPLIAVFGENWHEVSE